jgi:ABC-type amino acid transport system permease subunit
MHKFPLCTPFYPSNAWVGGIILMVELPTVVHFYFEIFRGAPLLAGALLHFYLHTGLPRRFVLRNDTENRHHEARRAVVIQ